MSKMYGGDVEMDEVESLRKDIQERMMRSQDWDRLMRALRVHLHERGWYDEVTNMAQEAARGSAKPRFTDVYSVIHDQAISSCPPEVRAELIKQIRAFIVANTDLFLSRQSPIDASGSRVVVMTTPNPKAYHYAKEIEGALCRGAWLESTPIKDYKGYAISWEETFRKFKKHCPGHDAYATVAVQTQTLATLLLRPEPSSNDGPPQVKLTPEGLDGDSDTAGAPFSLNMWPECLIPEDKREEARMALVALTGEDEKVKDTWSTTVLRAFFAFTLDRPQRALTILNTVSLEGGVPDPIYAQYEPVSQTSSHFAPSTALSTASTAHTGNQGSALHTILSRTGSIAGVPLGQRATFTWGAVEHIRTRCVQGMSHERLMDGDAAIAAYEAALPLIVSFNPKPGEQGLFETRRELWRWVEMLLYRASIVSAIYQTPDDALKFLRVYSVFSSVWPATFRPNHRATLYTLYIRTLCISDTRGTLTWRDEARKIVSEARVVLNSTTIFPRAGKINHKVLDFADGVVALWEAGGELEEDAGWTLWWTTRLTFHSYRVMRHLARLLFSVPESDMNIARRVFQQYVRLVRQARRTAPGDVDLQLKRRPTDEPAQHPKEIAEKEAEESHELEALGLKESKGRKSIEENAREVEKIRQGDVDDPPVFVDALVRGARMLVRVVEESDVEDALSEARDTVHLAMEIIDDEKSGLKHDVTIKARVYRVAGIVEALTAAREIDPTSRPNRQATALKHLTVAATLDPTSADTYYHLAFVQAEARATGDAILSARQAVERAPQDVRCWHLLGLLLTATEDWAGARAVIEIGIANSEQLQDELGQHPVGHGTGLNAPEEGVVVKDFGTEDVRSSSPQGIPLGPGSNLPTIVPPTGILPPSRTLLSLFARPGSDPDANPSRLRLFTAATQIRLTHMAIVERIEGPDGAAGMWPGVFAWYAANAPSAIPAISSGASTHTGSVDHTEHEGSIPRMEILPASPTEYDYTITHPEEREKDKDKEKSGKHLDLHKKLLSKSHRHVHELSRKINPRARRRMSAASGTGPGSMSDAYQASSIHSRHLHRRSSPATSSYLEGDTDFDPLGMSSTTTSSGITGTDASTSGTARTTTSVGSEMTVTNPLVSSSRAEALERRLLSDIWLASAATFRRSSRPNESQAAIAEAEWLDEANPAVWVQFGLYLGAGALDRAIESLHKALVIEPEYVPAVVHLSQLYLGTENGADMAVGMLNQTTQGAGWDAAEAWYLLGRACGMQGRRERQRACLAHALRLEQSKPIPFNTTDAQNGLVNYGNSGTGAFGASVGERGCMHSYVVILADPRFRMRTEAGVPVYWQIDIQPRLSP
ncbi:Tetratricopeptide repeats protein [Rhizoctonia solani]|uniref:Transcription and mRNA export factor SUS1 n=1 Tax=Rhizoctonia solani TaxID=456999 RepID=A0A8H7H5H8_9AGAM|nr:Tetratricopeptide repeats protein [Rhizoctonia solani]